MKITNLDEKMMKRLLLYILVILISACTSQPQKNQASVILPLANQSEILPESRWQLSYFQEPIFNSKLAVLEAGQKENPPIILIHGLGELAMKGWFSVIPSLEKNYHVIAIDLPGFGLSTGAKGRFLPANYADVIAAVNKQYSNGEAIVMGHSMGGAVALRYADKHKELVKQLILVDAAGLLEKSEFIKYIAAFDSGDEDTKIMSTLVAAVNDVSSSMIEVTTKENSLTNYFLNNDKAWNWLVSGSSNMNAALSLVEEDFSEAVHEVNVPVNIIWGEQDNIAPLRTAKVLDKQMRNTRLQVIKGAGHVPMKSHHAEFINALNIALEQPIVDDITSPIPKVSQGRLTCRSERNKTYSGYYDEVVIKGCDNIFLKNIHTKNLMIKGSVVKIENLNFSNKSSQIVFNGAVISMTNADISGHNTMLISGSRIDMAGVSIKASGEPVLIKNGSRISVSLSDVTSPKYTGRLHGAFYLSNQSLLDK